uniref:Uncharacterized protein n=1 Tax=Cannabis sativa TaxID=3483 RepID=A0A803Q1G3_CANSA
MVNRPKRLQWVRIKVLGFSLSSFLSAPRAGAMAKTRATHSKPKSPVKKKKKRDPDSTADEDDTDELMNAEKEVANSLALELSDSIRRDAIRMDFTHFMEAKQCREAQNMSANADSRGKDVIPPILRSGVETSDHLFFECPFTLDCLQQTKVWLGWKATATRLDSLVKSIGRRKTFGFQKRVMAAAIAALVYLIWKARNRKFWQQIDEKPNAIIQQLKNTCKNIIHSGLSQLGPKTSTPNSCKAGKTLLKARSPTSNAWSGSMVSIEAFVNLMYDSTYLGPSYAPQELVDGQYLGVRMIVDGREFKMESTLELMPLWIDQYDSYTGSLFIRFSVNVDFLVLPGRCGPLKIVATCSSTSGGAKPRGYGFSGIEDTIVSVVGASGAGCAGSCIPRTRG